MRYAFVLLGIGLVSCKAKGGGGMDDRATPTMDPGMAGSAAPAVEAAKMADKDGKADEKPAGKKPGEAPTWNREELALRSMQTRVAIDGYRARVVIEYVYANELDRSLEGTFQLRLPEEASPYFFAFGETRYEARKQVDKELALPADPTASRITSASTPIREWIRTR